MSHIKNKAYAWRYQFSILYEYRVRDTCVYVYILFSRVRTTRKDNRIEATRFVANIRNAYSYIRKDGN